LLDLDHDEPAPRGLALGLIRPSATVSLDEALSRRVVWQRRFNDVDYPLVAIVDGERWRLRFDGPGSPSSTPFQRWRPLSLVVDGRELGTVESWPPTWSR
jgi:hypothetical protein